jgi:hypothetical protein
MTLSLFQTLHGMAHEINKKSENLHVAQGSRDMQSCATFSI